MEKGRLGMPGFPRDLAVLDPWDASLERSRARRARAGRGRVRNNAQTARRSSAADRARDQHLRAAQRDLAEERALAAVAGPFPGAQARGRAAVRSRGLARKANLAGRARGAHGRAHRRAWPTGRRRPTPAARSPEPPTTTEHTIVLSEGSEGRQVEAASAGARGHQSGRHLRPGNRSGGAQPSRRAGA